MRKLLISLFILYLGTMSLAQSYLYLEQTKQINGSYVYSMPKLEWNKQQIAGKLFGTKCYYLSEFEGALIYTAPRSNMFNLNHHSLQAEWNFGVQVGPFWSTYSIGGRYYLAGNSDSIPEGSELQNTARLGIEW